MVDFNGIWYEKNKGAAIGVKSIYAYAGTLISAAQTTNDTSYLKRAHELIQEGAERAPTRIEFIKLAMEAAEIEKDQAAYNRAVEQGRRLRPNLEW